MATDPIRPFDGIPIRVLLIEDDDADYRRTCELLDEARHVTFVIERARGVKDAMARIGTGTHDVCLLDHALPDGDGLELVRAAHNRGFRTPIVMLTGGATLDLDLAAMALGVSDFLDKSRVDATLLERTIRYALTRHRQAASTGWPTTTS